jgi:hypothetical protein
MRFCALLFLVLPSAQAALESGGDCDSATNRFHACSVVGGPLPSASASAATLITPDNVNLTYSPYHWFVNGSASATTMNTGSYIRTLFTGNSVNITFNVSRMVSPPSQLYYKIDNGPLTPFIVGQSIPVAVPYNLTHGDVPYHYLEVIVKSMTETNTRWARDPSPSTRVVFTGLSLEGGAVVAPTVPNDFNILLFGDSISEGVLTLGGSQHFDTDHNDATVVYSYKLGSLLGGEIGVVGFGATGLNRGGSGGVPPLGVSWNQLWDGQPRVFEPKPDVM